VLACADSASGASAALDPARWAFMNTELSVHLTRPLAGEWVCVDAETTLTGTSTGLAAARLLDSGGLVGRSAQALFVIPR
jgi:acyl-coenzyme A thioesterase PaaI-like protein